MSNTINDAIERKVRKILFITGKGLHSNKEQDPYASKDLSLLRCAVPDHIKNNFLWEQALTKSPWLEPDNVTARIETIHRLSNNIYGSIGPHGTSVTKSLGTSDTAGGNINSKKVCHSLSLLLLSVIVTFLLCLVMMMISVLTSASSLCCACSFYSYTPHINSTNSITWVPACQEHNHRM